MRDACGCDTSGDCECLCDAVAAYAKACLDKGVCVDWRTPDFCRECPTAVRRAAWTQRSPGRAWVRVQAPWPACQGPDGRPSPSRLLRFLQHPCSGGRCAPVRPGGQLHVALPAMPLPRAPTEPPRHQHRRYRPRQRGLSKDGTRVKEGGVPGVRTRGALHPGSRQRQGLGVDREGRDPGLGKRGLPVTFGTTPSPGCYNCSRHEYFDQSTGTCVPCSKRHAPPRPHTRQPLAGAARPAHTSSQPPGSPLRSAAPLGAETPRDPSDLGQGSRSRKLISLSCIPLPSNPLPQSLATGQTQPASLLGCVGAEQQPAGMQRQVAWIAASAGTGTGREMGTKSRSRAQAPVWQLHPPGPQPGGGQRS